MKDNSQSEDGNCQIIIEDCIMRSESALSKIWTIKKYLSPQINTPVTLYTMLCKTEDFFFKNTLSTAVEKRNDDLIIIITITIIDKI